MMSIWIDTISGIELSGCQARMISVAISSHPTAGTSMQSVPSWLVQRISGSRKEKLKTITGQMRGAGAAGFPGLFSPSHARPAGPEPVQRVFPPEKDRNFFPQEIALICNLDRPERLRDTGKPQGRTEFIGTVTILKAPEREFLFNGLCRDFGGKNHEYQIWRAAGACGAGSALRHRDRRRRQHHRLAGNAARGHDTAVQRTCRR
jgi:hypothetical protein